MIRMVYALAASAGRIVVQRCMLNVKSLLRFYLLLLIACPSVYAQPTVIPVVTIKATDPYATWSGDTGTFTVFRDGLTNQTLNVYYVIGGTATNSADYAMIGNWVMIPAGVRTNTITVKPINTGQTNTETVVLKLSPSPLGIPQNYEIGFPASAVVYITPEGVTNIPPNVKIFDPTNGSAFTSPVDVRLAAFADDPDGFVSSVEFFAGDQSLGVISNGAILDPPFPDGAGPGTRAFFLTWSNPAPGGYILTAKATDNGGASTVSSPVKITIQQGPPPTNKPPVVKLTVPANGTTFFRPADIGICAGAYDPDGYVSTVEFFAGDQSLGIKTNNPVGAGPMNPFCLIWSNAPAGSFALTAMATDNNGATTKSDPIMIFVSDGPPPPTNYPPLVRIASPANGAVFRAPVDVHLYAYAFDRDGSVTSVEFFAGTNSLGLGQGLCIEPVSTVIRCPTNYFALVWSNALPGAYVLTAVATDDGGASATSGPVKIMILSSPPPPTNRPPVVSIIASDPLAIEGTNCWPWLGLAESVPTWSDWSQGTSLWRFFTNCGPKNATFSVRRSGDTNDELTVSYQIGGTATNGIDYVKLADSVIIPAGQRRAEITVVPLDDGPPDISSTVVLKLTAATNYVVGYPLRAAALILDSQWPRPFSGMLSDGSFHLAAPGPDGAWFHVDYSTDLVNWAPICTNQVVNGSIDFIDTDASGNESRFYRTVPEANPPN
jgi:hypothetical protein